MAQGRMTYNVRYGTPLPVVVRNGDGTGREGDVTVGLLHRAPDGHGGVAHPATRAFDILGEGRTAIARVSTEETGSHVSGRPAVYRVDDPYGAPLGRITYRRGLALRGARARWTVESVTGHSVRGFRGRLFWWVVWWPVGLPVSLVWLVLSLLGEGDDAFGKPRRVIWRDSSGRASLVFRGVADEYRVLDGSWDPRLVAALLGLHQSYDPSEGSGENGWYARP
ncbi:MULTISPECIES: hypothetical protein [Streptomyces]|nr:MULTISPECIES: hypothetical protein [Streptomyces]UUS29416.1 hypothetical protein NRO40_00255 [Streptomyces changanensis]